MKDLRDARRSAESFGLHSPQKAYTGHVSYGLPAFYTDSDNYWLCMSQCLFNEKSGIYETEEVTAKHRTVKIVYNILLKHCLINYAQTFPGRKQQGHARGSPKANFVFFIARFF